ncbi:nitrous oxide-stimulated promoter family protein [Vibrio ruber]|nr:nitrous oxide-stimulated promoter family protein [Vibrio ruber]WNJ95586.1 nitrous oxide-stimulated promoter family protein [Vibrio ruber]
MPDSTILHGRLATEFKTIRAMMKIYCAKYHHGTPLCESCATLLQYAEQKLDRCPYGQQKPACNQCPIHCYKPEPKAQIRVIMRDSGPRMLLHHPILAIRHLYHEKQACPDKPQINASNRHQRKQNPDK